eukprot:5314155-Heterocapsa_arctica.AAC.1
MQERVRVRKAGLGFHPKPRVASLPTLPLLCSVRCRGLSPWCQWRPGDYGRVIRRDEDEEVPGWAALY